MVFFMVPFSILSKNLFTAKTPSSPRKSKPQKRFTFFQPTSLAVLGELGGENCS
jgi:hypothetical protein